MEKRNNKKLFAIIGGSVLAFVLTIALSVSITLAYFGDTENDTAKITLGQAVTLNEVSIAATENVMLVPTQKADLTTTIKGDATNTDSYLFIEVITKVTGKQSGTEAEAETAKIETALNNAIAAAVGSTWVEVCKTTHGTLYALGTTDGSNKTLTPLAKDAEVTHKFAATFNMPGAELTNLSAESTIDFTVKAVRLQKAYSNGTTEMTLSEYQAIVLGDSFLKTALNNY